MDKIGFIFPGQGSQSIGMCADLAENYAIVKETFAEAGDVLNQDFWTLATEGPAEKLNQTVITQPIMLAADVAVWRCWQQQSGPNPKLVAGHSLGEYAALVAASAISYSDALLIVQTRAQAMQSAVPEGEGAMAAVIGLDDAAVIDLAAKAAEDEVCAAVNFNSPGQVVIAGRPAAIERFSVLAKEAGARKVMRLPMSVPSHCELMQPAQESLLQVLQSVEIQKPQITVLSNIDAQPYTNAEHIRDGLVKQIVQPVKWVSILQAMAEQQIKILYECGPGKVLTGLVKRTLSGIPCMPLGTNAGLDSALNEWLEDK